LEALPGAAGRARRCAMGMLGRGTRARGPSASLKQAAISPPAAEICLGEDHRMKTKTLKSRKKLF